VISFLFFACSPKKKGFFSCDNGPWNREDGTGGRVCYFLFPHSSAPLFSAFITDSDNSNVYRLVVLVVAFAFAFCSICQDLSNQRSVGAGEVCRCFSPRGGSLVISSRDSVLSW
jgi:hypothetical protein